jgi:hypothetical protein
MSKYDGGDGDENGMCWSSCVQGMLPWTREDVLKAHQSPKAGNVLNTYARY